MSYFRKNLAIDLGTTNVLVYDKARGVVINEPSVVAVDTYTDEILAVGAEAKEMLGRTPGNIVAMRPMKDGVIADYKSTERMLDYFIHKAVGHNILRPDIVICVPSRATQVQRRAVVQAASAAGGRNIYLIEEPLAAAIGSGVDISDPDGLLIVDIGGGTTDVALISMGGIVLSKSIRVAGDSFDQAIVDYIRHKYRVIIGPRSAENIKKSIGSKEQEDSQMTVEVKGRSLDNGLPVHVFLTEENMAEALEETMNRIVNAVHEILAETPPELSADLFDHGILLSGGGSLMKGLDNKLQEQIGIEVHHVKDPITAVVRGSGRALSWIQKMNPSEELYAENTRSQLMTREKLRKR